MNQVLCCDWLNNEIPEKSINLIIADPPYFEVMGEFDFVWNSFDDYLNDVERWAIECKRVLADNGCILWWGHAKKIAYSQIIFDKYFNLGNSIVWEKTECKTRTQDYQKARHFAPVTERCLFYTNEVEMTSREFIEKEFIAHRNPFSIYLKSEFQNANITNKQIAELFPSKTGGLTGCVSNWLNGDHIITRNQYLIIKEYLNGDYLKKEYDDLKKEYDNLIAEHDYLRRPFNNVYKLTDVIRGSQEAHISCQYDHETIKPLTLTKKLIQTTSRKGDKVLIPFGGSGTEVEACIETKRDYICFEIAENHYKTIKEREKKALSQMQLDL